MKVNNYDPLGTTYTQACVNREGQRYMCNLIILKYTSCDVTHYRETLNDTQ